MQRGVAYSLASRRNKDIVVTVVNRHTQNNTALTSTKNYANWWSYFKDVGGQLNGVASLDFVSKKPGCWLYCQVAPLCVMNLVNIKLTRVFRTKRRCSMTKVMKTGWGIVTMLTVKGISLATIDRTKISAVAHKPAGRAASQQTKVYAQCAKLATELNWQRLRWSTFSSYSE